MSDIEARELLGVLRGLCRRYRRQLGPALAEELAAEALLRGLRRPPPDGRMGPWLERILRNLVIDHGRRARLPLWQAPTDPPPTPEELVLTGERRAALARALGALPGPLREGVLGRFAGEGGVSRTRVHRGLARLRELMQGLRGLVPIFGGGAPGAALVALFLSQQMSPVPVPVPVAVDAAAAAPAKRPPVVVVAPLARLTPTPLPARRHYRFDDDQITGELQRPPDELVQAAPRPVRPPSLIEIPGSFLPAIAQSVEDL